VTPLFIGSLVGIFITSAGIIVAADTAETQTAHPGLVTSTRKIEMTGNRSAVAITGNKGWQVVTRDSKRIVADLHGAVRQVAAELRKARTMPVAVQVERLVAAVKSEAKSKVFPDMQAAFSDGDVLNVIVAGYDAAAPAIRYAKLRLDKTLPGTPTRLVVERGPEGGCWLLAGYRQVALGLIDNNAKLPVALNGAPSVLALRRFRNCDGVLSDPHARQFFLTAVDATVAYGAAFGIPNGSVGGDVDILRITPSNRTGTSMIAAICVHAFRVGQLGLRYLSV
jgi:hypothetical protein